MTDFSIPITVRGLPIPDEAMERIVARYHAELDARLSIALASGLRLATRPFEPDHVGYMHPREIATMTWEFVLLGPGEAPPPGGRWTIYERRADHWQGRSA